VTPARLILVVFLFLAAFGGGNASANEHWVTTWAASPQPVRWGCPWTPPDLSNELYSVNNQTVRMILHASVGGHRARVRFSNAYGTGYLSAGAVHIALRDKESAIIPSTDRALSFGGKASFRIGPGGSIVSDPVDLDVPALVDTAVSIYIEGAPEAPTLHFQGSHTSYFSAPGDFTAAAAIPGPPTRQSSYWLSGVDVLAPAATGLIVAFGDSLTDGARSTFGADAAYPAQLALESATGLAVVNEGISGNRLLTNGNGDAGLSRFDRDVLDQPGVKWVIVLEGINDIINCGGWGTAQQAGARDLIAAYRQIIAKARARGVAVVGGTLTPFAGYYFYSRDREEVRETVNDWIRTGGAFDAVIDFDAALRDPARPEYLRADYSSDDHLHPNDAGYAAMAKAVDLKVFTPKAQAR
jgi:lysophospholipase L1-like esterase